MALKPSLTTDEHAALDAAQQPFYKQLGTGFVLDVDGIDNLPGLEGAYRTEKQKREDLEKAAKPYAGIDPTKYAQLLELEKAQQVGTHLNKGEYEKAKELIERNADEKVTNAEKRAAAKMTDSQLSLILTKAGVLPERLEDAMDIARKIVRLAKDDTLEVVKGENEIITDAAKFFAEEWKQQKPYFYAPASTSGTGSQNGTNGSGLTGVDLSKMSATERLKYANANPQAATK